MIMNIPDSISFTIIGAILGLCVYYIFRPKRFKCPKCKFAQTNSKTINIESETAFVNGRRTESGNLDKRYNTKFNTYNVYNYTIKCEKCGHQYQYTTSNNLRRNMIQNIIDKDPVINELQKEYDEMDAKAVQGLDNIQKNDPDIYNELVKLGLAPKDPKK